MVFLQKRPFYAEARANVWGKRIKSIVVFLSVTYYVLVFYFVMVFLLRITS